MATIIATIPTATTIATIAMEAGAFRLGMAIQAMETVHTKAAMGRSTTIATIAMDPALDLDLPLQRCQQPFSLPASPVKRAFTRRWTQSLKRPCRAVFQFCSSMVLLSWIFRLLGGLRIILIGILAPLMLPSGEVQTERSRHFLLGVILPPKTWTKTKITKTAL